MAYSKTTWVDNTTPIDKNNLNKIEQGIYDNSLVVDAVTNTLNPTDTEIYKTAELTEGQITDVIGVNDVIIKGQTSQDGEPTPSSPVDVNVVSGSNVINTSNKNLLDKDGEISQGPTNNTTDTTRLSIRVKHKLKANTTYTVITNLNTSNFVWAFVLGTKVSPWSNTEQLYDSGWKNTNYWSYTTSQECYINIPIRKTSSADINANDVKDYWFMLYEGAYDSSVSYEPHQGKELPLDLPVENLFDYNSWLENKQNWETSRYSINKDYIISTMPTANDWGSLTPPRNATPSTADIEKLTWMSFPVKPNTEYTMRLKNNNKCLMQVLWFFYNENYGYIQNGNINSTDTEYVIFKFTTTNATKFVSFRFDNESYNSIAKQLIISEIQFEQSSKVNAYTPYDTDPIELCKIGNYQDYFYKSGSKWYLHKEINKITSYNGETITTSYISTTGELSTGAKVYYVVNSTNTEITNTTLISQLEAIYNAPLYEQTNITQTNNDLPMVLDITACKDNINGIKAFIRK